MIKKELREPEMRGGMPLLEAFGQRESSRNFSDKAFDDQDLSNLLWAAFGISRPESGKRTAPSALNRQEMDIYVVMKDGWYLYEPQEHALIKKGNEDLREYTGLQDFVKTAPLNLVFVSDYNKLGDMDDESKFANSMASTGFISQNVYLYCASAGLATVVRGYIDRDKMREVFKLDDNQHIILSQTVGYPGK